MPKGVYDRIKPAPSLGSLSVQYKDGYTQSFHSVGLQDARRIAGTDAVVLAIYTPYAVIIKPRR